MPGPRRLRPRWKKLLADLWGNKARTLLVVASIAVGVFAIGVITGTYMMLSRDLALSYEASNPANVTVRTLPFDDELVEAVRRTEGVAHAEGVHETTVRIRTGTQDGIEEWDTLKLVAHPDYADIQIHRRFPMAGKAVPADQELILEHKTLDELGLTLGQEVSIELPDGTRRDLPVVGTAMDQSDPYNTVVGGLSGYITLETLAWFHTPTMMNNLLVTSAEGTNDDRQLQRLSVAVTDRLEESGYPVLQTEIAASQEHPFGNIIQALLWVLIIVGVFIAVLSSSLIANTISALLTQHLRQIGVMKLVGARRFQIIGLYLLLIMSFGGIALLVAVPLGSIGAYELSRFAAAIINFRLQPFRPIPQAIIIQVVLGLLLPPLAALLPVLKGSQITVSDALSSTGLSDKEGRKGQLSRLTSLGALSRPLLISIRNTFRRKKRLLLTLFTLTLGGAVFIGVFSSQVALDETVEAMTRYFGADVTLDFSQLYRIEEVVGELSRIPGVLDVEVWTMTNGDLKLDDETPAKSVGIIAPPADSELVEPRLIEGRWILPGDENAVAFNEVIWETRPDLRVGDTMRLEIAGREDDWIVVGV
ncbi:MAG: ABC transporter permease, partial [Anaerolineae bacterium]